MSTQLVETRRNEMEQVQNPFGEVVRAGSGSVADTQMASHEIAEMQAQIYLAKQFPRDTIQASQDILNACQRPGLANVATYSYQRGGTDISGPSIRLAEEIARDWGNIECGWNELERNEFNSKVRAYAWDKQTNTLKVLIFIVPLYRTSNDKRTKIEKRTKLTSERDIYEHLANHAARRMRNCILALIPGDVVEAAVEQCKKTMVTSCNITPETIKKLLESFKSFGVSKEQIEKRIQRKLDSITPAQFVKMREIYASMKDEMSEIADWFEIIEDQPHESQADRMERELAEKAAIKPKAQEKTKSEGNAERLEPQKDLLTQGVYDIYLERAQSATSFDELKKLAEDMKSSLKAQTLDQVEFDTLAKIVDNLAEKIQK